MAGRNRQETDIDLEIGVDATGAPIAVDMQAMMNAGAYVASGMGVTRRIGQGALYLYTTPNARFRGITAYTNRPAGGSFRGLGAPLGHFALEVTIDRDRARPRHRPARLPPGAPRRAGRPARPAHDAAGPACAGPARRGRHPVLEQRPARVHRAGAEAIGWRTRRRPTPGLSTTPRPEGRGIATSVSGPDPSLRRPSARGGVATASAWRWATTRAAATSRPTPR